MAVKKPSAVVNNYYQYIRRGKSCDTSSGGDGSVEVALNGVAVGSEPQLNFIEGDNINLTITDTPGTSINVEIDVTGLDSGDVSDFNEAAQDAVGGILAGSTTVGLAYSDATPSIIASAITQMSITSDASGIKLSGDVASPGNSYYYGTNGSGTKGYFVLPSPGTGDVVGPASSTDNAVARWDLATGKLLQDSTSHMADNGYLRLASTTAPTHPLTFSSGSTGIALYNTSDETNFERLLINWQSNVAFIGMEGSGTATGRSMLIRATNANGTSQANLTINRVTAPWWNFDYTSAVGSGTNIRLLRMFSTSSSVTHSSSTATFVSIEPTVNQSGTAGYTGLLVNPTETTTGSGVKALINAQVGGAARFFVGNTLATLVGLGTEAPTHTVTHSSTSTGEAYYNTADQTTNFERVRTLWSSNVFYLTSEAGGTQTARDIQIGVNNGAATTIPPVTRTIWANGGQIRNIIRSSPSNLGGGGSLLTVEGGSYNNSTGSGNIFGVTATIAQTSTAGYTAIFANITESTTGSGTKRLIDLQTGATSRFWVDNVGNVYPAGSIIDVNSNELLKFTSNASAVNELTISNGAAGAAPRITATGDDTDINIGYFTKGAGVHVFRAGSASVPAEIRFLEASTNGSSYIGLKAPANVTTSFAYELPTSAPSSNNQFMIGSTAGVLSWSTEVLSDFVTLTGSQVLTNKTLTSPIISTISNTGTLTLPTSTDTLVGRATTDTLTNKTVQLPETGGILLDAALSADGTYSGISEAGTAGTTLAFGDLVYLAVADSRWELADADAAATAGPVKLGICVLAAAADGDPTTILLFGKVRADANFPALTVGAPVYVSTTPGDVQVAAPSGTGDIVRIIGYANTADELYFSPDNSFIELA